MLGMDASIVRAVTGALLLVIVIAGCGGSSRSKTASPTVKRLSVHVLSPDDGVRTRADRVTVRGTVAPDDADVQVVGRDAQVGDGVFTVSVPLHAGANTLDVVASRNGSAPVSTSITVTRAKPRHRVSTATSVAIATGTSTAEPPAAASGDWPGGSGYTVILASLSSETQARSQQAQATSAGLDAGVLYSSNFRSLRPGYWVVFSGVFSSQGDAVRRTSRAKSLGYATAYPRFISP
jgi:hypothetical protein